MGQLGVLRISYSLQNNPDWRSISIERVRKYSINREIKLLNRLNKKIYGP